jgi:hypothetical protein
MQAPLDGMRPLTHASGFVVTCTPLACGLLRTWRLPPPSPYTHNRQMTTAYLGRALHARAA